MSPLAISAAALVIDRSSPLGVGASCAVNRATLNAVPVAAKTCAANQSAEEQFSREVRRLHACRHPNIINVYGVAALCESPSRPADLALVTELCAGGSLQAAIERLRRRQLRRRRSRRSLRAQGNTGNAGSSSTAPESACDESGRLPAAEPVSESDLNDSDVPDATLPIDTIVRVAGGVASALAYLHDSGLSQGDVKPLNVLLTQPMSADGSLPVGAEAKMCDFGLSRRFVAKSQGSQMTPPESSDPLNRPPLSPVPNSTSGSRSLHVRKPPGDVGMQGTVPYLAPEAFSGIDSALACAADVYALGICLYELVTLRAAWPHHSNWGVFNAVFQRGERPSWPTETWATAIAAPWRELVEMCWHQDPASRPTARFVLSEIVRIGNGLKNCATRDPAVLSDTMSNPSAFDETSSQSSESLLGDSTGDVEFLNLNLSSVDEAAISASESESGQESCSEKCSVSSSRSEGTIASTIATGSEVHRSSRDASDWMVDSVDELLDGLDLRKVISRRLSFVLDSAATDTTDSTIPNRKPRPPDLRHSGATRRRRVGVFDESDDSADDSYLTEAVHASLHKGRKSSTETAKSGSFPARSSVVAEGAPVPPVDASALEQMSKSATPALQNSVSKCSGDADAQLEASIANIVEKWNVLAARRPVKKKRIPLPENVSGITAESPASLIDVHKASMYQPSSKAVPCAENGASRPHSVTNPKDTAASETPTSRSSLCQTQESARPQNDPSVSRPRPEKDRESCVAMSEEELNSELAHFVSSDSLLSYKC